MRIINKLVWSKEEDSRIIELVMTSETKDKAFSKASMELGKSKASVITRYYSSIKGNEASLIQVMEQPKRGRVKRARISREVEDKSLDSIDVYTNKIVVTRYTDMYGNEHRTPDAAIKSNIAYITVVMENLPKEEIHNWVYSNKELMKYLQETKPYTI